MSGNSLNPIVITLTYLLILGDYKVRRPTTISVIKTKSLDFLFLNFNSQYHSQYDS
jgi:hypothetical protein